jgi:hypothetical protein
MEQPMIDWLYAAQLWISVCAGLLALAFGLAKRKPSAITIGALAIVQFGLLVQLVASIVLVILGERAKQDTVEFFAYLIVALMIPLAAAFWALIERTRWSTLVLGAGSLTVAVMLVRMSQIWSGF